MRLFLYYLMVIRLEANALTDEKYQIRVYSHNNCPDYTTLDDFPNYYDLTFVLSGSLCYLIDGKMVEVMAGNAVFYTPGSHRIRTNTDRVSAEYFSINFFTEDTLYDYPALISNCQTHDIQRLLRLFETVSKSHTDFRAHKQSLLIELILITLRELLERQALNPHVVAVLDYVHAHLTEKLTLKQIAESVSLAPTYCGYLVKRELGFSIFEMIIRERMELAQKYIMEGEKSLQEICYLCGYNDYSYFSKHYKRFTGTLPSKTRQYGQ